MRGEDGRIACVRYVLPDTRRPTGLARGAGGSPHARVPTASSNSRRLTSWTGWPISCRRRGSTGIAITGCSPRITSSGPPSRPMTKGNVGKRRDAATGRHAVNGHAAGGDATGDCCGSCDKPPSHDTSRRQRPTSLLGWAMSFLLRARGVVATSGSSRSDCFPSAKPSLAFALLATSGCCGLPVRDPGLIRKILTHLGEPLEPPPVSPARGPPTDWGELVQVHDECDVTQTSPDELPVIDIRSL